MPDNALQEVTEAAFGGVLRALEARELDLEMFPGPIIVGLVAWPRLDKGTFGDAAQSAR